MTDLKLTISTDDWLKKLLYLHRQFYIDLNPSDKLPDDESQVEDGVEDGDDGRAGPEAQTEAAGVVRMYDRPRPLHLAPTAVQN